MNCMKCGREIEEPNVFCQECLAEMANYPVKPGTVVQLPRQSEQQSAKKTPQRRKQAVPLEEQVKNLRRWVLRLFVALLTVTALLIGGCYLVLQEQKEKEVKRVPGQNYSSATATLPNGDRTQR